MPSRYQHGSVVHAGGPDGAAANAAAALHYPYGLLTMFVSLEAIFLSTFVMISENRADEKRQVLADHQWQTVQEEEQQNEQLLQLSTQILELTKAIHAMNTARSPTGPNGTEQVARCSTRKPMADDQE